jgi:protocatechuate 3,4-dioxygenase beta subunit
MKKLFILSIILVIAIAGSAQNQITGEIKGIVRDAEGNGVKGAHVDILNAAGAVTGRRAVADIDGRYEISSLRPGYYDVQYSAPHHSIRIVNKVIVGSDMETLLDMQLRRCEGREYEVFAYYEPLMNRQDTRLEQRVAQEDIHNMNINDLAAQKVGVEQRDAGGPITISGSRQDEVLYIVNGVPLMNRLTKW